MEILFRDFPVSCLRHFAYLTHTSFTGCTQTLRKLAKDEIFPFYKMLKFYNFSLAQVKAHLQAGKAPNGQQQHVGMFSIELELTYVSFLIFLKLHIILM